jgi:Kef-type K+ transport system membrane component KefB
MSGHAAQGRGGLRKLLIVLVLVGGVILLYRFQSRASFAAEGALDPTALLAFGFVVLASYSFGQLVERVGLPHITGYLVAGMLLGPSAASLWPAGWSVPSPLDTGVLSGGPDGVMEQLGPLNVLAVALIAMTAGGELKIANLRKGLRPILSVLGGQVLFIVLLSVAFLVAISGAALPSVVMPGLEEIDMGGAIALGLVVGAISVATSPAATIAVINDLQAAGSYTRTMLATVVLKDVVVVVAFAFASTFALQALGGGAEGDLGLFLLQHIGGAMVAGSVLGLLVALYLRFVKAEPLLFFVGVIYVAHLLAQEFDLDPVVLFIVSGFATANFSNEGDAMLETIETLSMPVYVVFFTLSGAHVDLVAAAMVLPFALGLSAVRLGGIWAGIQAAGPIGALDENVRKHGFLAFVSQAGVAISLANLVGANLGEAGRTLSTLLLAGIAIHELVGPVLLKLGLTRAGEVGGARPGGGAPAEEEAEEEVEEDESLAEWPVPERAADAWGPPLRGTTPKLREEIRDLQLELSDVVRRVAEAPLQGFEQNALAYVQSLRREFLRHHRRITVQAGEENTELAAAEALRLEQAELAEKWRGAVLNRAAELGTEANTWDPVPLIAAVDGILDGVPASLPAPVEDAAFEMQRGDGPLTRLGRLSLRFRNAIYRLFGGGPLQRRVELQTLARYHLWGMLPARLETVAALQVRAEGHLAARTRSAFDGLVLAYDGLASALEAHRLEGGEEDGAPLDPEELAERLREIRQEGDIEFDLARGEVQRIARDLHERTSAAIGRCLRDLKEDLPVIDTPDLPRGRRRASRLYLRREEMIGQLERGVARGRDTSVAVYSRLALEMELIALEARVKDVLEEQALRLGRDTRGKTHRQVERVLEAVGEARETVSKALRDQDATSDALAQVLRDAVGPVIQRAADAADKASALRDQLAEESAVGPVLDTLNSAAQSLTDRYRIPAGAVPRGEHNLPSNVPLVDVPTREWVLARIETSLAPRLVTTTREMSDRIDPLAQGLSELERRLAFNLELATGELVVELDGKVQDDTRRLVAEIIEGALERNAELFEAHRRTAAGWGPELRKAVRDSVISGLDEIRGNLVDGQIGRLRSQIVRDVRGRQLSRRITEARAATGRALRILRRGLMEAVGASRVDGARQWLGLPAPEPEGGASLSPPQPSERLPMVYRRLFSAQALEAGDILTGREEALQRVRAVLDAPATDGARTPRAVALVGPDGVGKSAFVSAVVRTRRAPKVRELKLKAPATIADVDALFDRAGEGNLIVVSGLQWLRSLRPGGFRPLRRFVSRVLEDGGRNAILIRAESLVWDQARRCAPLDEAFPEVVRLDPLDPEGLTRAVLARHTVSGYGLAFRQGDEPESAIERLAQRIATPLARPRQTFFRGLHASSGGLLRDALRLWLASVETVDEGADFIELGPVPASNLNALRRLPEEDVMVLYQVARQGWMNAEVHGSLFRVDEAAARAKLDAMAQRGVLEGTDGVFRIAVHLRGSVHRLLEERGFLA